MKKSIFISILFFLCMNAGAQSREFKLYSYMTNKFQLEYGDSLTFWGYGYYLSPGNVLPTSLSAPLLKAYNNEEVLVKFYNLSGEDHTIHLHGLDVDTRNDGVPHTWFAIDPNDSTGYSFNTPYPGSYLYHCHVMTVHHLAMGMYGMIIVKNYPDTTRLYNGGPGFNKEYQYLFTDMDTAWNANPTSPGHLHSYHANYFMINGKSGWQMFSDSNQIIQANAGDSVLVHFAALGYNSVALKFPSQMNARVYMSDGRVIPNPFNTDSLRIYPGERYEVIFKPVVNYSGYINASFHNAIVDREEGSNFIGINSYVHPISTSEIKTDKPIYKLYPNPSTGTITVESPENGKFMVCDKSGSIVMRGKLNQGENLISLGRLSDGFYIINLNGNPQKLIIVR